MADNILTLKLPESVLAELGATPADFQAKLTAFLADAKADKARLSQAQETATVTASANADIITRLAAVEANVAALQKAPAFDRAALLSEAKADASNLFTAMLAKTGGAPIAAASVAANDDANNGSTPADPKARWAADKKLQAEFSTAESYDAYCKAEARGAFTLKSLNK